MTYGRDIDNSWTAINIYFGFVLEPAFVLLEVLILGHLANIEVW